MTVIRELFCTDYSLGITFIYMGRWNDGDILGVTYGIAILRYNPYDDYYYYEDYDYIYYDGNNNLCDYEQTNGIYQIHYDEPYDPEDEMANPIEGAFFRGGISASCDIILIIYVKSN